MLYFLSHRTLISKDENKIYLFEHFPKRQIQNLNKDKKQWQYRDSLTTKHNSQKGKQMIEANGQQKRAKSRKEFPLH